MEIKRLEITDELADKINKFCQSAIPKGKIPKCFGDPILRSGLCSPKYPVPPASPDIPKPRLCGLFHICLIHLGESLGVTGALMELPYEKLHEACVKTINDFDAKEAAEKQAAITPPVSAEPMQEQADTLQASSKIEQPITTPPVVQTPDSGVSSQAKVPFRRDSIPFLLWNFLSAGSIRSEDALAKFMKESGKGQMYYIIKVKEKAKELGVLVEQEGGIKIG